MTGLSSPAMIVRRLSPAIHLAVAAAALCLAFGCQAVAAEPDGDWLGVLAIPGTSLRVAVHLHHAAKAGYAGTLDQIDQGVWDAPLGEVAASADTLSFKVPALDASYAAKWDPAAGQWVGQWTRASRVSGLNLAHGLVPPAPVVAGLDGDWDGAIQSTMGIRLRLAFHIKTGPHGTIGAIDSIDQKAMGVPISSISREGATVRFDLKLINGSFQGPLDGAGQTVAGQWTQPGVKAPLTLTRRRPGQAQPTLNRPQTPAPPYPYREEQVAFTDDAAHVRLAGTLTLPKGEGPFPVAVLVAGSGRNTRDEPIMGHQLFLVLADHLTRAGIAVLRYDKRGTGQSSGDYDKATTLDFADDAQAGMAYLRTRKDIDPRHIGLIGHSEGGLIVPIVATRDPKTAFIVMMAGPGVFGADVWIEQQRLLLKAAGRDDKRIATSSDLRKRMISIVRTEKDSTLAAEKLRASISAEEEAKGLPPDAIEALVRQINSNWFRSFLDYDPAPTLAKVRCPVLALNGSKDLQVPAEQNLPVIRTALASNPDAEVDELPNLNHLFQTAKTGGIGEYGQIEETMAPIALQTITTWVLRHVGRAGGAP